MFPSTFIGQDDSVVKLVGKEALLKEKQQKLEVRIPFWILGILDYVFEYLVCYGYDLLVTNLRREFFYFSSFW